MEKSLDIEFEKAVRLLVKYMPSSEDGSRKPILFHDIRVGTYLYEKNYSREIVLAGVLHDAIEWSDMGEDIIKSEFGEDILRIVVACSKNRAIQNSQERLVDMVERCVAVGKEAMIIKAVDTIDSFKHYTKTNNQNELKKHCQKNAENILKYLPKGMEDPIFEELRGWIK